MRPYHIAFLGNAPVDLMAQVDDDFITRHGLKKGDWQSLPAPRFNTLMDELPQVEAIPGGSGANTGDHLARMGLDVYLGTLVGDDQYGRLFHTFTTKLGIDMPTPLAGHETLLLAALITPDGQRTFATAKGRKRQRVQAVPEQVLDNSQWLYVEAYVMEEDLAMTMHTCALARQKGVKIALTLASPRFVETYADQIAILVNSGLDLIICNDEELEALEHTVTRHGHGSELHRNVLRTPRLVTHGKDGATYFAADGSEVSEPCPPVAGVISTNGAGDAFAAGFMYGLIQTWPMADTLKLGHRLAGRVIQQMGARLESGHADLLNTQ